MKWTIVILLSISAAFAQSTPDAAHAHSKRQSTAVMPVAKVLTSALSEVKAKSRVAVLLPSELPEAVAGAKYASVETASQDEYAIELDYELGVGDSGFAAFFTAKVHPKYAPKDIGNVREVKLSHGFVGYFRPVSCGGSCAPANLWWEKDDVLYQFQLQLSPTLSERDQQSAIVAAANSAIVAGAR
ncbi:MAG TPA: hypothetical protein VND90_06735 [Terracidiphilus sp.]|nr:hypothetical protein [Terracidiphilus sp.]